MFVENYQYIELPMSRKFHLLSTLLEHIYAERLICENRTIVSKSQQYPLLLGILGTIYEVK